MLRSVREECGLGCPPDIFTTNASESWEQVVHDERWTTNNEQKVQSTQVAEAADPATSEPTYCSY